MSDYAKDCHFHKIGKSIINLLTNQISALYYTAIKDRLYCDGIDSRDRRAAQYTLLCIIETITRIVAPIVPHLAEEMYQHLPQKESKTYFTKSHPEPDGAWLNDDLDNAMNEILNCRKDINKLLDTHALESDITIRCSKKFFNDLKVGSKIFVCKVVMVNVFFTVYLNHHLSKYFYEDNLSLILHYS